MVVLELNTAYEVAAIAFESAFDLADPKAAEGGITLMVLMVSFFRLLSPPLEDHS